MNNFLVKTSGLDLDQSQTENNSVKTLMLLHGWGMNSQVWEPIREVLESKYHVIWVDLPGHGFNRQIEAHNLEQIVDVIADVTPDNTHLIGWSLGGLVAQALAQKLSAQKTSEQNISEQNISSKVSQKAPHKIRSMTLVTSTPRFSQHLSAETSHTQIADWQHAMSDDVLNRFADNLKQDTEKTLKGFIALQFIGVKNAKQAQNDLINHILYDRDVHDKGTCDKDSDKQKTPKRWGGAFSDDVLEPKTEHTNIPTQQALDVGLDILKHADLRKFTPTCPEHWIFAEYDRLIPKEVINDLISLRPDAEITLLEKSGHAPFITHTQDFLKRTTDFIDALD